MQGIFRKRCVEKTGVLSKEEFTSVEQVNGGLENMIQIKKNED